MSMEPGESAMEDLRGLLDQLGVDSSSLSAWPGEEDVDEGLEPEGPVYQLTSRNSRAIDLWLRLRGLVPQNGFWPVLLGYGDDMARIEPGSGSVEERLARARNIDPAEWFRGCQEDQMENLREQIDELYDCGEEGDARRSEQVVQDGGYPRGPWPEGTPVGAGPVELFSVHFRPSERPIYVGLVPTRTPWQVPSILNFGGWNACPQPAEHSAILKYWLERYDAELLTVTNDVLEFRVGRPPSDRESAIALAKEQYLYCPDIVEQGTDTIDRLAAALLGSPVWFFWWD